LKARDERSSAAPRLLGYRSEPPKEMERKSFFKQRKNLTDREVVFLHPDIAYVQLFQRPDLGPQGRRLRHPPRKKSAYLLAGS